MHSNGDPEQPEIKVKKEQPNKQKKPSTAVLVVTDGVIAGTGAAGPQAPRKDEDRGGCSLLSPKLK